MHYRGQKIMDKGMPHFRVGNIFFFLLMTALEGEDRLQDILHFKNGETVEVEILEIGEEKMRYRSTKQLKWGEISATTYARIDQLKAIDFSLSEQEKALIDTPRRAHFKKIEMLWEEKRHLLALPHSRAGEIGLIYARFLSDEEKKSGKRHAKEIYERIEERDWNKERKMQAQRNKLFIMIVLGEEEWAETEARSVVKENEDPKKVLLAQEVLGKIALKRLKALFVAHPRWKEDPSVRPHIFRVYNQCLDCFLYPFLFHGSGEKNASLGLAHACVVHHLMGEEEEAHLLAEELFHFYPETKQSPVIQEILEQINRNNRDRTTISAQEEGLAIRKRIILSALEKNNRYKK